MFTTLQMFTTFPHIHGKRDGADLVVILTMIKFLTALVQ